MVQVEYWVTRALFQGNSWTVKATHHPDLIFVPANFSRSCVAGKRYAQRQLWDSMLLDPMLWRCNDTLHGGIHHLENANPSSTAMKLVPLQYGGCGPPWQAGGLAEVGTD